MSKGPEYLALRGLDPEGIRRRLTAGGDPAYPRTLNEDLHEAACEGVAEAIEVLVEYGADVESVELDETPLWVAVRRGHRDAVAALLRAGADPWRPVVANRSPGWIALTGPLGDLFRGLPGAPVVEADWLRRQAETDALVARYDSWDYCGDGEGFAFVADVDEDMAIRRLGLDPAACPVVDEDDYLDVGLSGPGEALWLGQPPGGTGVALFSVISFDPGSEHLWCPLSSPGLVTSVATNMVADDVIEVWRDGVSVRYFQSLHEPEEDSLPEEWLCRFYDRSQGSPTRLARGLALGTLLTGVEIDEEWLFHAPKRLVTPPSPQLFE
ncbi:ankyrin repeat domain-containing protein [Planotetraspora sp. A-T 1434]|uniref:ankyrin repeat domain-containing protein n=1 Tax=Planotetraspora sp. A-T 1434 TaxID=2979219 RepID=UPI0021C0E55C|nr:ankyrin repeat domain-containing protein [Planotetraspora sp. A-T 1434]MCT9933698.1 ankyrin repeat domain-containing protein [Planotetraspora sp. A-T 1434]